MSPSPTSLLDALRQHGLLTQDRLDEAVAMQGRFADQRDLARELALRGWLTPLQVNRILQGRAGELVLSQYVLQEKLGEGGMGQVYRAWQRRLDRLVALKLIRPQILEKSNAVERFQREARVAARLSHPNIVLVHDADEAAGIHFLVMELVEGSNLSRLVQTQGRLPASQACDFVRQGALGLQHVYEKGLVHRDIKPQNLLLTKEGVVKVADFGLAGIRAVVSAAMLGSLTVEGEVMGTSDFMSPEQARDARTVDIRGDLYSLGCTLYYLLAGRVPFPGGTLTDKLLRHQQDEPEPIERLRPDVPPSVPPLMRRLLAKDPKDRYETPAQAAAALAAVSPSELSSTVSFVPSFHSVATGLVSGSVAETTALLEPSTRTNRKSLYAAGIVIFSAIGLVSVLLLGRGKHPNDPNPNSPNRLELPPIPAVERFDWQPKELVAVLGDHRLSHWGQVFSIAFSPDGRELASGGSDELVRLWDKADGTQLRELRGHIGSVFTVAYSPDGRLVASAGGEVARLWDRKEGKLLHLLKGHTNSIRTCAFDSTNQRLATGSDDRTIRLWDTATGKEVGALFEHTGAIAAIAFSPDGKLLVCGSADGTILLWRVGRKEKPTIWKGHEGVVMAVAFSRQGTLLASGGEDGLVLLWDIAIGQPVRLGKHEGVVRGIACSSDGKTLASTSTDGTVRLWDLATRKPGRVLKGFGRLNTVAFSPTDEHLVAAGGDSERVHLWDCSTGVERFPSRGHIGPVSALAFHPDGKTLASGGEDGTLRIWDFGRQNEETVLARYDNGVFALAFQPGGKLLASATGYESVHLWDTSIWKVQSQLQQEANEALPTSLAFTCDGRNLALAIRKPDVRIWNVADGRIIARLLGHAAEVRSVTFSPDDQTLAAADGDWNTNGCVKLWKWAAKEGPVSLPKNRLWVQSVAYAPDGRNLASAGADGVVRVWDLTRNALLSEGKVHTDAVNVVIYAPDGRSLASAGTDGRIVLWEPATAMTLSEWKLPGAVGTLAFHPESRLLAVGNCNGTIYLLRLPELEGKN